MCVFFGLYCRCVLCNFSWCQCARALLQLKRSRIQGCQLRIRVVRLARLARALRKSADDGNAHDQRATGPEIETQPLAPVQILQCCEYNI